MPDEVDEVEEIPVDHEVSRQIFWPHKFQDKTGVIWASAFMFSGGDGESVVWRKYKPQAADVHELGCEHQKRKKASTPEADFRYVGFITAQVGAIQAVITARGFSFAVIHDPSDGQGKHHAEIRRQQAGPGKPTPNDKSDLLVHLKNVFSALEPHSCG